MSYIISRRTNNKYLPNVIVSLLRERTHLAIIINSQSTETRIEWYLFEHEILYPLPLT